MRAQYLLFLSLILLLLTCPACDQNKGNGITPIAKIEFDQLIIDIGNYQGKVVQIKGLYMSGFEESGIYIPRLSSGNPPLGTLENHRAIWVEFDIDWNRSKSQILKSLPKTNTLVTLQGIIDTTNKGHLQQYAGALEKAKLISSDK